MKILFLKTYRDPYDPARYYQPGWVAEFTDADAERAISEGFAEPAPAGAYSRKGAAPSFECAAPAPEINKTYSTKEIEAFEEQLGQPFKKAGEITLDELTGDTPEAAIKEARRKEGGFFGKK